MRTTVVVFLAALLACLIVAPVASADSLSATDSDPDECTTLDAGTQTFSLTVDYDLGNEEPERLSADVSEEGYGSVDSEVDLTGRESQGTVTFEVTDTIKSDWDQAVVQMDVWSQSDDFAAQASEKVRFAVSGSDTSCETNPETVSGSVTDGDGNGPSGEVYATLESQQTGASEATALSDGTFSFTGNEFVEPGDYYLAVVQNDPYEYWGHTTVDVDDGDSLYETLERGGVYLTGTAVEGGDGSRVGLGQQLSVSLDAVRPRNGDDVVVETYVYPTGEPRTTNPDDTYSYGSFTGGQADIEYDFEAPRSAGEYRVDFVVKTSFARTDYSDPVTTDVVTGPTITVEEFEAPSIESASPSSSSLQAANGETRTFSLSVVDEDTAASQLSTVWYVDGERQTAADSFPLETSALSGGTHTVEAVVSDGTSRTADATRQWRIEVIEAPTITELRPGNTEVTIGQAVSFSAAATDPGGYTPVTYEWTIDGETFSGSTVEQTFQTAGKHDVSLAVTNGRGVTRTKRFTIDARSRPPEITTLSLSRSSIVAGESVTLDAAASDPAGRSTGFSYEWSMGTDSWNGREVTLSPQSVGRHDVTLTVTNGFGTETTETVTFTVRNDDPVVERVAPSGQTIAPVAGQSNRFAVAVTDHDAQPVTATLSIDGSTVAEQQVTSARQVRFRHTVTTPGEHTAEITVTDAHGASDSVLWTLGVQSRPPQIEGRTPDGSTLQIQSGASRNFSVDVTDPDGESLAYEWYVDSEFAGSGPTYEHTFPQHGQYSVRVVATDASGTKTAHTWNVSVVGFREQPVIDQQLSSLQLDRDSGAETASISVTNPATNQRSALVEVVLEVPDSVDVTGTGDVLSSSPSQYRINETIPPGNQESLSVHFTVDDDIEPGSRLDIDYSVFYHPRANQDDIHVVENDTREISIATATPRTTAREPTRLDGTSNEATPRPGTISGTGPGFGAGSVFGAFAASSALIVARRHVR